MSPINIVKEEEKEKTILLVESDRLLVKAFSRSLFDEPYEIIVAQNVKEVFKLLKKRPEVECIIISLGRIGINSYDLMLEVRKRCPKLVRILLSEEFEDVNNISRYLKNEIIHGVIPMPWVDSDISAIILDAFTRFKNSKSQIGSERVA